MEVKILPDSPDDISTFYIQATESIQQRWPRTLKQGDTFGLFDALGDCVNPGLTPGGLFHNDTRYLSGMQLLIDGQRPLLLSSAVASNNWWLVAVILVGGLLSTGYVFLVVTRALATPSAPLQLKAPVPRYRELVPLALALLSVLLGLVALGPVELILAGRPDVVLVPAQ